MPQSHHLAPHTYVINWTAGSLLAMNVYFTQIFGDALRETQLRYHINTFFFLFPANFPEALMS